MSATIHYLRPFQREKLDETPGAKPDPLEAAAPEPEQQDDTEARPRFGKPQRGRSMPCGRDSKWKKKIGGGVVPRDEKPT